MSLRLRHADDARRIADAVPAMTGGPRDAEISERCGRVFRTPSKLHGLLFTRDDGTFTDHPNDRCYHLSLSFVSALTLEPIAQEFREARTWCSAFFGEDFRRVWIVPPESDEGRRRDVWHYALFVSQDWSRPVTVPPSQGWRSWGTHDLFAKL